MFSYFGSIFSNDPEPTIVTPDKKKLQKNQKRKTSKRKVNKKNQKVYDNVREIYQIESRNEKLYNMANRIICQKNEKIKSLKAHKNHLQQNIKKIISRKTRNKDELIKRLLDEIETWRKTVDKNKNKYDDNVKYLADFIDERQEYIDAIEDLLDEERGSFRETLERQRIEKDQEISTKDKENMRLITSNRELRYQRNEYRSQVEKLNYELTKIKARENEKAIYERHHNNYQQKTIDHNSWYIVYLKNNAKNILRNEVKQTVDRILKKSNKMYEDRISELMKMIPPPHILEQVMLANKKKSESQNLAVSEVLTSNFECSSNGRRSSTSELYLIEAVNKAEETFKTSLELFISKLKPQIAEDATNENPNPEAVIVTNEVDNFVTQMIDFDLNKMENLIVDDRKPMSSLQFTPESQGSPVSETLSSDVDFLTSQELSAEISITQVVSKIEQNIKTSELLTSSVSASDDMNEMSNYWDSLITDQTDDSDSQMKDFPSLNDYSGKRHHPRRSSSEISMMETIVELEESVQTSELSPSTMEFDEEIIEVPNPVMSSSSSDISTPQLIDFNLNDDEDFPSLDGHCKRVDAPKINSSHLWRLPPPLIFEQKSFVDDGKPISSTELTLANEDSAILETISSDVDILAVTDVSFSEIEQPNYEESSVPDQTESNLSPAPQLTLNYDDDFPSLSGPSSNLSRPHIWVQRTIVDDEEPMPSMELKEENVQSCWKPVDVNNESDEMPTSWNSKVTEQTDDSAPQINLNYDEDFPSLDGHCEKKTQPRKKTWNNL